MKVFTVLAIFTLFIGTHGASISDVYEGPVYHFVQNGTAQDDSSQVDGLISVREPEEKAIESGFRARRFTCDVLSFQSRWVSPNHSACAVRCLTQRYRGGKCENGICICRGNKWGK